MKQKLIKILGTTTVILLKVIAYPFIAGLILIACIRFFFKHSFEFFVYGGELVVYKEHTRTINEVYDKIKEMIDEKKKPLS